MSPFSLFLEMLAATFAMGGVVVAAALRCAAWGSEDDFGLYAKVVGDERMAPGGSTEAQFLESTPAHRNEPPPFSFRDRLAA